MALGDHEVASVVQFDDGSRVGLYLGLKRLVFLELALSTRRHKHRSETLQRWQGQSKENISMQDMKVVSDLLTPY